jgi:hypothetical protein
MRDSLGSRLALERTRPGREHVGNAPRNGLAHPAENLTIPSRR